MLTVKQFQKLPLGTKVRWCEPNKSRADGGELVDHGVIVTAFSVKSVQWEDGQITDGRDDWALKNIELADAAKDDSKEKVRA